VKAAFAKIEKMAESVGTLVNGWQIGAAAGNRDFYKGNWALRAGPVVALHAAWTRGAQRVAGSWIAAIGLLMLDVCCIHTPPVATQGQPLRLPEVGQARGLPLLAQD
jgi:hypothetical protein